LNILITGASGYLGSKLTKRLVSDDHKVTILLRETSSLSRLSSCSDNFIIERFSDLSEVHKIIKRVEPEVIIHTACLYGRNGELIYDLLEANLLFGITIIDAIIQLDLSVKFINTDTCLNADLNAYSLSKSQFTSWGRANSIVSLSPLTFINVNLQQFYGPGDDVSKLPNFILQKCFDNSEDIELTNGTQLRDFIYIDDVVEAYNKIILNLHNLEGFVQIDLGSGISVPVRKFIELIHLESKSTCKLKFGSIKERLGEPGECIAFPNLLYELGWKPAHSLTEGIKLMVSIERNLEESNRDFV
jgi:CDP-paratose synthetase